MRLLTPRALVHAGAVLLAALGAGAASCDRCEQNETLMDGACVRTCNSARECTGEEECVDGICRAAMASADGGMAGGSSSGGGGGSSAVGASSGGATSRAGSSGGASTGSSGAGSSGAGSSRASGSGSSSSANPSSGASTGGSTGSPASSAASGPESSSTGPTSSPGSGVVSSSGPPATSSSTATGSSIPGAGTSSSAVFSSSSAPGSSSTPSYQPTFQDVTNAPLDALVQSALSLAGGSGVSCSVNPDGALVRLCLDNTCSTVLADWSPSVSTAQPLAYVQVRIQTGTVALESETVSVTCNGATTTWTVTTAPPYVTFASAASQLTDAASYVFNDQALGPPMPGRILVVAVHTATNINTTISSVTVGAVTLVKVAGVAENVGAGAPTALFAGRVPTGSMGNIQVNLMGIPVRCGIGVQAVYGIQPTSIPRVVEYEGPNPTTINLVVVDNGVMVTAMTMNQSPGGQAQWTNVVEAYDFVMLEGTNTLASGAAADHLTAGNHSVDVSAMSGGSTLRVLAVTWP